MEQHGGGQFYNSVFFDKDIIVIFHFALEFIDILLHHCSKKKKKMVFDDWIIPIFSILWFYLSNLSSLLIPFSFTNVEGT